MTGFRIITLFPELYEPFCSSGIISRAIRRKQLSIKTYQLREYAKVSGTANSLRENVDDYLFGGGAGMLLKPEVLGNAVGDAKRRGDYTIAMAPSGRKLDRELVCELAGKSRFLILSGRYEGFDGRFLDQEVDLRLSIGDFVAMGGDAPAMMLIEAIIRRQEDVLGSIESVETDSFEDHLLEEDHYTRPAVFGGEAVPDVLRSGNHKAINAYRRLSSLRNTLRYRPELLEEADLSGIDREYLKQIYKEFYCGCDQGN